MARAADDHRGHRDTTVEGHEPASPPGQQRAASPARPTEEAPRDEGKPQQAVAASQTTAPVSRGRHTPPDLGMRQQPRHTPSAPSALSPHMHMGF